MSDRVVPPVGYGMRRYAMIDCSRGITVTDGPAGLPVVPAWLADVHAQLPILFDMAGTGAQADELIESWRVQSGQSAGECGLVLLDTEATGDALMKHLCDAMLWTSADGRRHLLRYFDPRVMAQLEWLLAGEALQRVMGPVQEWHLALDGGWHTISASRSRPYMPPPSGMESSIALGWMPVINPAIAAAGPADVVQRQRMGLQAYELLSTAQRRFGLRDPQDLTLFVQHGLSLHPQFHDHPLIRRPLEQLHGGDLCYRLICAQLGAEALQRIRVDLIHLRGEPQ